MEARLARSAGFCWGVQRAMDILVETAEETGRPVYTLGPLIHNQQVMDYLHGKGIRVVDSPEEARDGVLVIRAHGITPERRRRIKASGVRYVDGTCPDVGLIAARVKKFTRSGYGAVIVGIPTHAEAIGLKGYSDNGHVVSSPEEVDDLPEMERIVVVSQSTQQFANFQACVERLRERFPSAEMEVFNTICKPTATRQTDVERLADEGVQAIVVVGGRHSANTTHLAAMARARGLPTFHIETDEELDPLDFAGFSVVGVTAGASTPNWMIQKVVERLEEMEGRPGLHLFRRSLGFLVDSHLYLAGGAAAFSTAVLTLGGYRLDWRFPALAALYVFAVHTLNLFAERDDVRLKFPARLELLGRHRRLLTGLCVVSVIAFLGIASTLSWRCVALAGGLLGLGLLYRVSVVPKRWRRRKSARGGRLDSIPGSKDLFLAGAWAVLLVGIPAAAAGEMTGGAWLALALVGTTLFVRSVLNDIRYDQEDRMVGRETIPILIGKARTKVVLGVLCVGTAGLLSLGGWLGWASVFSWFCVGIVSYICLYLILFHVGTIRSGRTYDLTVDGAPYLAGLLAGGWHLLP